jgi:hypothetical protein
LAENYVIIREVTKMAKSSRCAGITKITFSTASVEEEGIGADCHP